MEFGGGGKSNLLEPAGRLDDKTTSGA